VVQVGVRTKKETEGRRVGGLLDSRGHVFDSTHWLCYGSAMTKEDLEAVAARIRALPADKQDELLEILEWLEEDDFFEVPKEAWPGIERGLAEAEAGNFATEEEVAAVFAKAHRRQD
jgi:hypothetical protein